jgi:hypothetical protein
MKSHQWTTYRTRFLVKAKQLTASLTFTDALGRQHCGRKGDYLVESCDGVLTITPRQIFEDVYVSMPLDPIATTEPSIDRRAPQPADPSRVRRKHPQPVRSISPRSCLM